MSVTNYQSTLRKIAEERRFHSHRGGSLQSRNIIMFIQPYTQGPSHFSEVVVTTNYKRNFRTRWNTGLNAPPELVLVFFYEMNNRFVDIVTASDRRISRSPVQLIQHLGLSLRERSLSFSVYPQAIHQNVQHLLQTIQTRKQQLISKTVQSKCSSYRKMSR